MRGASIILIIELYNYNHVANHGCAEALLYLSNYLDALLKPLEHHTHSTMVPRGLRGPQYEETKARHRKIIIVPCVMEGTIIITQGTIIPRFAPQSLHTLVSGSIINTYIFNNTILDLLRS